MDFSEINPCSFDSIKFFFCFDTVIISDMQAKPIIVAKLNLGNSILVFLQKLLKLADSIFGQQHFTTF